MRKRKEPTHDQTPPSTFPKVRHRKGHPITIEGFLRPEKEAFIRGENAFRKAGTDAIKLKLIVSPSDWPKLWSFCVNYQNDFARRFYSDLIYPAMMELETKKGAKGNKKSSEEFVRWIKTEASFLYAFFSYWTKRPVRDWPDYLQTLVGKIEKDGWFDYLFKGQRGTNRPYKLTRYCIEKGYRSLLESHGLRPFDNPQNFLKTYIYENGRAR